MLWRTRIYRQGVSCIHVQPLPYILSGAATVNDVQVIGISLLLLAQAAVIVILALKLRGRSRLAKLSLRSEGQSRHIVDSSPIGICVVSNRRFVYVNTAYVRMFGYSSPEEIVGRFVEELYTPDERKRQRQFAKDRPAGKPVPRTYDTKGLRKDGSHFDVVAWVSLIEYDGQASSLGYVIDRSVEKQLRSQLEKTNRLEAIGTLAGGIAHDFNNILTAIIGYTDLALLKAGDNVTLRQDLQHVRQAGRRAKELVQQILTFSRNREGTPQIISASSIVREVMGLVRASMPSRIEIRAHLDDDSLIYGDPAQLHQLLMNLCANAEYAMRGGHGVLEISLAGHKATGELAGPYPDLDPGEYLMLAVTDSGIGIPENIREKVFEPFFTTKEAGEGTGMGLSQVHGIVRSHGGHIRVEENSPCGTRFIVFFPVVRGSVGSEKQAEKVIPGGTERILVVDDEEMVVQVTSQILRGLGYTVHISKGSLQALEMVTEEPDSFDLVLSDMDMPGMTGEQLAKAMLSVRPDLSIILCSGFYTTIDEATVSRLGVRAFLDKPVGKEHLARTVRNVLDEAEIQMESLAAQ